jgi:hypothetical protein
VLRSRIVYQFPSTIRLKCLRGVFPSHRVARLRRSTGWRAPASGVIFRSRSAFPTWKERKRSWRGWSELRLAPDMLLTPKLQASIRSNAHGLSRPTLARVATAHCYRNGRLRPWGRHPPSPADEVFRLRLALRLLARIVVLDLAVFFILGSDLSARTG